MQYVNPFYTKHNVLLHYLFDVLHLHGSVQLVCVCLVSPDLCQVVSLQCWDRVVLSDVSLTVGGTTGQAGLDGSVLGTSADITRYIPNPYVGLGREGRAVTCLLESLEHPGQGCVNGELRQGAESLTALRAHIVAL